MAASGDLIGGRYRLLEPVGRGGMGTVWTATDVVLGRDVAVKEVVPPPGLDDTQRRVLRERTMREARAAARLSIHSAVTVYDVVEEDDGPWIVMERLDAPTLAEVVREQGRLPAARVAEIGLTLLAALQAAHASGVLHRDVKPSNVMLPPSGAVLTDFGIAALEDDPALTMTGMLVGSPAYMAPERARGEKAAPASDLWSLGATLYAAVEGHGPFDRDSQLATLHAVVSEEPAEPVNAGPLVPVLLALLAKDPAARPDAVALRRLLERAASQAPGDDFGPDTELAAPVTAAMAPGMQLPGEHTTVFPVDSGQPAPAAAMPPSLDPEPVRRSRLTLGLVLAAIVLLAGTVGYGLIAGANNDPAGQEDPGLPAPTQLQPDKPTKTKDTEPSGQNSPSEDTPPTPDPTDQSPTSSPTDSATNSPTNQSPTSGGSTSGGSTNGPTSTNGPSTTNTNTSTQPPPPNQPSPPAVPAGYQLHADPTGFTVAVPGGWSSPSYESTYVDFVDPNTGGFLRIDQTSTPGSSAVAAWEDLEVAVSQRLDNYQRIRLEPVAYRDWEAADWEFTWQGENSQMHVLDRGFVTSPEHGYAIYWSMPEEAWADSQDELAVVTGTFQPAP